MIIIMIGNNSLWDKQKLSWFYIIFNMEGNMRDCVMVLGKLEPTRTAYTEKCVKNRSEQYFKLNFDFFRKIKEMLC